MLRFIRFLVCRLTICRLLGQLLVHFRAAGLSIFPPDLRHIAHRFLVRRNIAVFLYRAFAGIVSGDRQTLILERLLQELEVADSTLDVVPGIEAVLDSETASGR